LIIKYLKLCYIDNLNNNLMLIHKQRYPIFEGKIDLK